MLKRESMWKLVVIIGLLPWIYTGVNNGEIAIVSVRPIDITKSFKVIFQKEGHIRYAVYGNSFRETERKRQLLKLEYGKLRSLENIYFIWGGEVSRKKLAKLKKMNFVTPQGRIVGVTADEFVSSSAGEMVAYTAYAEISELLMTPGNYEIADDTIYDNYGGYAVIEIHKDERAPYRKMKLILGLKRLKPGEVYHAQIFKAQKKGTISRFSTMGGGARGGNGSSNSLNGFMVSGSEDWNGSSGSRWDVDDYDMDLSRINFKKGLWWRIDPLLQWVFPMGSIIQIDVNKKVN